MGIGVVLTTGADRCPLPERLADWLVEVRVEMELSRPSRFAVRFEEDLCDGQPSLQREAELRAGTNLGVFALRPQGLLECLVHGPITTVASSAAAGGAGSWLEVRGEDRRVEMGRLGVEAVYTGRASAAAAAILSAYGFAPDVQQTRVEYDGERRQLTQRGTDLAFLEDVARRNNMELWIDYEATGPVAGSAGGLGLVETARLRTSPERDQLGDVPQVPVLVAQEARTLRVNPPPGQCRTVNRFQTRIDYERPTAARGFALSDTGSVVRQIVEATEPLPGRAPMTVGEVERRMILPPGPADDEEAFLAKDALVTEQSWFVEVQCSTTVERTDFLLRPHQVVDVSHAGEQLSGPYQVRTVTHVVTPAEHFMDATLRANGLGGPGS